MLFNMERQIVFVTLFVLLKALCVATFSLTMTPDHLRVTPRTQTVTFTCSADVALAACQFRWWDGWYNKTGPLLELSRGPQSQADPAHLDDKLTGYSYSGRGLGAGDCGVSLQVEDYKIWMVACRVRAETGVWKYAWADLYAHISDPLPLNLATTREVVVLPGGEMRILLKAGEPLDWCWFDLPGGSKLYFNQGAASLNSTGRHLYLGAGPRSGECGLALRNISEADNGPVRVEISTPSAKWDERYSALIVARPPTAPTLSLVYTGNNVTATCEVQESRPVANMSWVLDDAVIREDDTDDTQARTQDEWRWPWTVGSIKQTVMLQLQPQDNLNNITCMVSHVTLDRPLEATERLSFTDLALSITPLDMRVSENVTTVNFTCLAGEPLTACQFTWIHQTYISTFEGPILDLGLGHKSLTNTSDIDLDFQLNSYKYQGRGLDAGECGVSLEIEGNKDWLIGCRVKGHIGGWSYNWTTLLATSSNILPLTTSLPREKVVSARDRLYMKCDTIRRQEISGCYFYKPGTLARITYNDGPKSENSIHKYRYIGEGMEDGNCGIRFNVLDDQSGPIQCVVNTPNAEARKLSMLLVASPPSPPVLEVRVEASHIIATCTVNNSRPAANITWWRGEKVFRQDSVNNAHTESDDPWQWPWDTHYIVQTVTYNLKSTDRIVFILCEVNHVSLDGSMTATKIIRIPSSKPVS